MIVIDYDENAKIMRTQAQIDISGNVYVYKRKYLWDAESKNVKNMCGLCAVDIQSVCSCLMHYTKFLGIKRWHLTVFTTYHIWVTNEHHGFKALYLCMPFKQQISCYRMYTSL